MQVTINNAKEQLPELIAAAQAGEEVIIADGDRPVARIVPLPVRPFRLGGLVGVVPPPPDDFFEPLSEDELREWE